MKTKIRNLRIYLLILPFFIISCSHIVIAQVDSNDNLFCGSLLSKELESLFYKSDKYVLDVNKKGDANFGGDVDIIFKLKVSLSNDKKQIKLSPIYWTAKECCNCHNPDIVCGLDNNNSTYTGNQGGYILYNAPENYVFEDVYSGEEEIKLEMRNGGLIKSFPVSRFSFIEAIEAFGSNANTGDVMQRGIGFWILVKKKHSFILRRTENCIPKPREDNMNLISYKASNSNILSNTYVLFNNYFKSLVLDASASQHGKPQLWTLLGNSNRYSMDAKNQKWELIKLGNNIYKIKNLHFNKVLDASASKKGTIQLWDDLGDSNQYVENANNQKWKFIDLGNNLYKIKNMHFTDMVLDASSGTKGRVQLWKDDEGKGTYVEGSTNQEWLLIPTN